MYYSLCVYFQTCAHNTFYRVIKDVCWRTISHWRKTSPKKSLKAQNQHDIHVHDEFLKTASVCKNCYVKIILYVYAIDSLLINTEDIYNHLYNCQ